MDAVAAGDNAADRSFRSRIEFIEAATAKAPADTTLRPANKAPGAWAPGTRHSMHPRRGWLESAVDVRKDVTDASSMSDGSGIVSAERVHSSWSWRRSSHRIRNDLGANRGDASTVHSHTGPKTGKSAGIGPPTHQWEFEMQEHLIFLPLIVVILEVKVKITWKIRVVIQKR